MERPASSLIASVVVHAAVIGAVVGVMMFAPPRQRVTEVPSVPVQIVSEALVLGGAPPEPVEVETPTDEIASGAEVESIPDPTPPEPTPPPPRATTTQPSPPRKTPPPRTPPRPQRPPAPGLNLDEIAGPRRPNPPAPGPRTPPGPVGPAQQTSGPVITAMFQQVERNWNVFVICDLPGGDDLRVQIDVTLSPEGRIVGEPDLVGGRGTGVQRTATDEAMRALRATAPFDVPPRFTGGRYRATFLTQRVCAGR